MTAVPLPDWLVVRGAREHNLADVSVRLPHRGLVVFTGLSGSGKSSLAFDTIYAECQRRQVQSMSAFARQFLGEMDKPDVEAIEGLCSGVALDQRTASNNPRSTVATATDVYDLLRILYARIGRPHCTACAAPLESGGGRWCCPRGHDGPVPELSPRAFSFNLPHGACPTCQGLGTRMAVDLDLVVPDPALSLAEGALAPWRSAVASSESAMALAMARRLGVNVDTPWHALPAEARRVLLHGEDAPVGRRTRQQVFRGVLPWLFRQHGDRFAGAARSRAAAFMRPEPCQECDGARLSAAQRTVRLGGTAADGGLGIGDLCAKPVVDCLEFLGALDLTPDQRAVAAQPVEEIITRLGHLVEVGLDHLTLNRAAPTLSGGEAQRLRLAQQLGTGLFGLLYVLDEPTVGLHPADVARLLTSLRRLRDQGNSVLIVEHDEHVVRAADWVVDLGPGAGENGGRLLYSGPLDGLLADENSITGGYLSGRLTVRADRYGRDPARARRLVVRGAREHNLANLDVAFPLGCFTAVTGVSGSGKSTLVDQILYRAVARIVSDEPEVPGAHRAIDGACAVSRVVRVGQTPIGRTPRSNPATYTGAFDPIRAVFARTPRAKELGYSLGRFSFNTEGGRCETCGGDGLLRIDMRFLPDVFVPCDTCHGTRYNSATLQVRYQGLSIADVLALPVHQAAQVFADVPAAARPLRALDKVGLGYLRLGQQANTLSGGEAQRVKLAAELSGRANGNTLYVLDEPTTGLHPADVSRLLDVLHGLVHKGNTVVVVEHDLAVIASADWVLELGPGSGANGGRLVAEGTPEDVAGTPASVTGPYLTSVLDRAVVDIDPAACSPRNRQEGANAWLGKTNR